MTQANIDSNIFMLLMMFPGYMVHREKFTYLDLIYGTAALILCNLAVVALGWGLNYGDAAAVQALEN